MTMEQDQGRFLLSLSQPGGARKILFTLPLSFCQLIPIGRTVVNRLEGPGYSLDSNGREEVHGRGLLCFKEKTLLDFIFCLLNHLENKQLYSQSQREESQPSLFHMAQKLFFAFSGQAGTFLLDPQLHMQQDTVAIFNAQFKLHPQKVTMLLLHKFSTNAKQYLHFWLVKLFHLHLHCSNQGEQVVPERTLLACLFLGEDPNHSSPN